MDAGRGFYACLCCKRSVRSVGYTDAESVRMCGECFDLAGEEGHHSDAGRFYESPATVLSTIKAVADRGGDASVWDELKKKAELAGSFA